ncbi:MAG: Gfo/Idh/MocA family oxidoreductase [Alkalibacterium sp.]|nr:Gfo/Idh/MocA family oxidoreductase [Alkalibacterium sp.]
MEKLRLGTIGTSGITEQFIQAAVKSEKYSLEAVYSRTQEKAAEFKNTFGAAKAYADWEAFLTDPEIDVIYIASPNSLHFSQAKDVLKNKKHAIVEKPMVTSLSEWDELIDLSKTQGKMVVEAARHIFEPNFIKVTEMIQSFPALYGASLTYSKYSSRYDNVLKGEEPAIFSPRFSGGAANDLGIYVVYAALQWFGKPKAVHAFTQKIKTGVDGKGTAILRYDEFDVTLNFGKINTSIHQSEVYGPDHTLILDAITGLSEATLMDVRTKETESVSLEAPSDNPLMWEAIAFSEVMTQFDTPESRNKLNTWWTLSKQVHEVLDEIRSQSDSLL